MTLVKQLVNLGFAASMSEARRKIREGAVWVNSQRITDAGSLIQLRVRDALQFGKGGTVLHEKHIRQINQPAEPAV